MGATKWSEKYESLALVLFDLYRHDQEQQQTTEIKEYLS